jgi:hypothetical protein
MLLFEAAILTEGVIIVVTVIATLLEAAVSVAAQTALLVSTHVTTSPLPRAVVLNVLAFIPALIPFTFH